MAYPLRCLSGCFNLLLCLLAVSSALAAEWKPAPGPLTTPWTSKVDPAAPLPEYPRPQLTRAAWTNLNGLWDYTVCPADMAGLPAAYEGKILVPFPIESILSGVKRTLLPSERLWCRRTFPTPKLTGGQRLLLNFGAINWRAEIYINGAPVREHLGGYDAFSIDLTDLLKPGAEQEVLIAVDNPVETGAQPRGKQVSHPNGIWYTAVTGIWQTVWLETVPPVYLEGLTVTPDFDHGTVSIEPAIRRLGPGKLSMEIAIRDGQRLVAQRTVTKFDEPVVMALPQPRAWSPADPFLYEVDVVLHAGDGSDRVGTYFGLRKIEVARAPDGFDRIFLNNHPLFLFGPLDQGWWPDGLYTAATDEALRWDVTEIRRLGFNLVRKHVKVEPARWYYHADRAGLLVWQDMPSAAREGTPGHWISPGEGVDGLFTPSEDAQFRTELGAMVRQHSHFPSIITWVTFNEGWGQHRTNEIIAWVRRLDPTRLINGTSGWNDFGAGDMIDLHAYPAPRMTPPQAGRVSVLGEYGGLGLPLPGHLWREDKFWGDRDQKNLEDVAVRYGEFADQLKPLIAKGLGAAIYTQITDVEGEINGLVTYDRKVIKIPEERIRAINQAVTGEKEAEAR